MVRKFLKSLGVPFVLLFVAQVGLAALALGPLDENSFKKAWALYTQKKYAACADALDALIGTSTPNARLYYHAALANRASNRNARARQLCQYLTAHFAATTEATYAQRLYPESSGPSVPASASSETVVPDALKGRNIAELMKTEEGRKAVEAALAKKEAAVAKDSAMVAKSKGGRPGQRVFSAADIAKDGANGIDQMYYPNCWFESSMSALARLPRGQQMIADMIRYGPKEGTFVVRFPGDGAEYTITEEKLEKTGIHDKALWATLIECAQTMKYPDDEGGQLHEGLHSLTGRKADYISPSSASDQELASFIQGAVTSNNPIVAGTSHYPSWPPLVCPGHAYTIIGFEPSSGMIKIRNPHGANSQRFSLDNDPNHRKFEQLDDGVFRIHMSIFKSNFNQVARSNI